MQKLYKNRYYIAFILSLCLFFTAIISMHSYYNLKNNIQPASDIWARTTSLGAEDLYKKQPSIILKDDYADILTANKSNFTHVKIDRRTRNVEKEVFNLKGVESYKIQKFDWDENNIYFIESNSLYYAVKNPSGGYSAKVKIEDDVKDFDMINSETDAQLAVAQSNGITIFKKEGEAFVKLSTKYEIEKLVNIAVVQDKKGILHVAAYAEVSTIDFPISYLTLENSSWGLKGSVTERSLSESWSINDIDIGIDDTDAYIFYEMQKWDKFGVGAKTHFAVVPLYTDIVDIKFEKFFMTEEDKVNPNLYMNEPRLLKSQEEKITLTVVKDTYDKKYSDGFSAFMVSMDHGKVEETSRVTTNQRLVGNTANVSSKGDTVFVYLDAAGGFNYQVFYTETGKAYYDNAKKATKEDYSLAIMETIPGYVSTFIVSFIKISIYFPVLIWFLVIEFFEIKKLRNRPKLTYTIGLVLYMIMKLATFGSYYTSMSIAQMPPILAFTGAKYFYAFFVAFLAFGIQKLLKKHNPDMHLIAEFIVFALIDIEFTNLLFATYMV